MAYCGDERRRLNQEMWDRDLPAVNVVTPDETNDVRVDDVFDVTMVCGGTCDVHPHKYRDGVLKLLDFWLAELHEQGGEIKITPAGRV